MKSGRIDRWQAGRMVLLVVASAGWFAACNANGDRTAAPTSQAGAPLAPEFKPAVSINELMVRWIDNAGHVLWDVEKEGLGPKNDADWVELEDHALQLAAAGSLIQMGGTGQADGGWIHQVGWKTSAQAMTTAALADLSAAKARNLDGVIKANGELAAACEACHNQFKPELPSEGVVHQRPHSESHDVAR